ADAGAERTQAVDQLVTTRGCPWHQHVLPGADHRSEYVQRGRRAEPAQGEFRGDVQGARRGRTAHDPIGTQLGLERVSGVLTGEHDPIEDARVEIASSGLELGR